MADSTRETSLSRAIHSREKRDQFLALLSVMMVVVTLFVVHAVMRQGIAMTHKETILDCHYAGDGAHKHTSDCYDKGANLVCPLEERALHKHDDSCYTTEYVLTCEQEEGPDHTHTDECYETVKVLTCEEEEVTEEHVHGPGCFKTVTVRNSDGQIIEVDEDCSNIKGLELEETSDEEGTTDADDTPLAAASDEKGDEDEVSPTDATATTEDADTPADESEGQDQDGSKEEDADAPADAEAQDGDADEQNGSTVETVDAEGNTHHLIVADEPGESGELDESEAETDSDMPAQSFTKVVKDAEGNVLVRVVVEAPEGAFPAGTTMRVVPVTTTDVTDAIEEAVAGRTSRKVVEIQVVDITFRDADGNEIEPAKKISVKMTSDHIGAEDDPLVVHVDNEGVADVVETSTNSNSDLVFDAELF